MRHLPALDGLRGVAVAGVLLFHAGVPGLGGGFLGVSTFFTLSGFLITALLLGEHDRTGTIGLRRFWIRRARRLLPAALVALLGIAVLAATVLPVEQIRRVRGDLLAALLDVANWRFLLAGQSYGDLSSGPSPVQHFWSLSIEEQFYLVFPLLALVALRAGGRRLFTGVLLAGSAASLAASLVSSGSRVAGDAGAGSADAAYFGTHTRAVELLVGALLAVWLTRPAVVGGGSRLDEPLEPPVVRRWSALGVLALVGTVVAWRFVPLDSLALTRGGLFLHALVVAVLLRAVVAEAGSRYVPAPLTDALSVQPLVALGRISYGVYLYHWPVFVALDAGRTGLSGVALLALRLAVTLLVAGLSYRLVERPIRAGRAPLRRPALLSVPAVAAVVVGAVLVVNLPTTPPALAHADVRLRDFHPSLTGAGTGSPGPPGVPGVPGVPGPSASTTTRSSVDRVRAPRTVMLIGDSVAYDVAPALSAAFTSAGTSTVVDATWPGIGLTSGFGWRDYWSQEIDRYDPDVVVMMIGRWDHQYLRDHGPAAYQQLVDEAGALLSRRGAKVEWIGVLTGPSAPTSDGDANYQQVAAAHPGGMAYDDVNDALTGPDGGYLLDDPDPRGGGTAPGALLPIRKPDGLHLCPAGAQRVAARILAGLVFIGWSASADDGWQDDDWRGSKRFASPPGGCAPR